MPTPNLWKKYDRALKTHSAMKVIRDAPNLPWEWDEMSADDFEAKLQACNARSEESSAEQTERNEARGRRDASLKLLRDRMREFLGLAKRKFRRDEAKMRVLRALKVGPARIGKTLAEAQAVEAAWETVDASYAPDAGNTLATFQSLRAATEAIVEEVAQEVAEERKAAGKRTEALNELHRLSVDWFQEASRRFKPGTPHGDMIRGQVPRLK
jgi:hypothetical protein